MVCRNVQHTYTPFVETPLFQIERPRVYKEHHPVPNIGKPGLH